MSNTRNLCNATLLSAKSAKYSVQNAVFLDEHYKIKRTRSRLRQTLRRRIRGDQKVRTKNKSMQGFLLSVIAPCALSLLSACTHQQMYEAVQHNRKQECLTLPPAQQNKCLNAYNQSYEDYNREREALIKK